MNLGLTILRATTMISIEDVNEVFARVTEEFEDPIPIGGRCESKVYYRVESLTESDTCDICAEYVAERIKNVVAPSKPQLFLKLPGGYSFFAERLCAIYSELFNRGQEVPLEQYLESKMSNGFGRSTKGKMPFLSLALSPLHGPASKRTPALPYAAFEYFAGQR